MTLNIIYSPAQKRELCEKAAMENVSNAQKTAQLELFFIRKSY